MKSLTLCRFGLTAVVLHGSAFGQGDRVGSESRPRFEVASVKTSKSQNGGCKMPPLRLTCTGYALDTMVLRAYNQRPFLVQGMPSWASHAFYDVNAVIDRQATADA